MLLSNKPFFFLCRVPSESREKIIKRLKEISADTKGLKLLRKTSSAVVPRRASTPPTMMQCAAGCNALCNAEIRNKFISDVVARHSSSFDSCRHTDEPCSSRRSEIIPQTIKPAITTPKIMETEIKSESDKVTVGVNTISSSDDWSASDGFMQKSEKISTGMNTSFSSDEWKRESIDPCSKPAKRSTAANTSLSYDNWNNEAIQKPIIRSRAVNTSTSETKSIEDSSCTSHQSIQVDTTCRSANTSFLFSVDVAMQTSAESELFPECSRSHSTIISCSSEALTSVTSVVRVFIIIAALLK